ncbi:hypothetical protein Esti_001926 [Eimeria stiedai]
MLLDENLVQALKSQAHAQQDAELRCLREQKAKLTEAEKQPCLRADASPEDTLRRPQTLAQTAQADEQIAQAAALGLRLQELEDEIRASHACSRERFQQLEEENGFARAAVERWTDNIAIIRKPSVRCRLALNLHANSGHFTKSRLGVREEEVDRLLELVGIAWEKLMEPCDLHAQSSDYAFYCANIAVQSAWSSPSRLGCSTRSLHQRARAASEHHVNRWNHAESAG